ncbi:hypothetical protein FNO01nite_27300 [Flavobacterium noncentrifugens]|uniref:pirin family protein n=1 Tax=Flavobacterium noncentrifugens TaxID=1128970 RepID=UPI000B81D426|nr:hypothetical protein [Flavobacterium noncentrifugens]GEP52058.1 hypothetical protein FNO01nite_27300 [Flavobacterium noncentrifugens]
MFFSLGIFETGKIVNYKINIPGNGIYLFLIEGKIEVGAHALHQRDAIGITDAENFDLSIHSQSKILLVEVPMAFK